MEDSVGQKTVVEQRSPVVTSLIAGAMAGTAVDVSLFPLDTVKTRLQSSRGFRQSGGFSGLYKGLGPVLIGSAPTAALFFLTYDGVKYLAQPRLPDKYYTLVHMGAAVLGEVVSCLVRVPVEVVKQRRQALLQGPGLSLNILYRGYWSTVLRDTPFSLIQFSLWEKLKRLFAQIYGREPNPAQSAACGAVSGALAAAITTPVDVAKTRIMLSHGSCPSSELTLRRTILRVYQDEGVSRLFSGVGPRVAWITLGGFVFFGVYEQTKLCVTRYRNRTDSNEGLRSLVGH